MKAVLLERGGELASGLVGLLEAESFSPAERGAILAAASGALSASAFLLARDAGIPGGFEEMKSRAWDRVIDARIESMAMEKGDKR